MTKDVIAAIEERCSVRRFKPDPVPAATIGRLVDAARRAPSAGNLQPWHFTVVLNERLRRELAAAAHGQSFVAEAPACIVVSAEPERSASRYGERGRSLYCLQDTAAAAENLLLAATAYGLGSCWVGAFDEEAVRRVLGLDRGLRPVAIIVLGLPAGEGDEENPLRSREEVVEIRA